MKNSEIVKIKVKFVYTKEFEEVTAVFINENKGFPDCYSHIGQHSICSTTWINEQKQATKKQYLPLLKELQSIGYEVEILNN